MYVGMYQYHTTEEKKTPPQKTFSSIHTLYIYPEERKREREGGKWYKSISTLCYDTMLFFFPPANTRKP